MDDHTDTHSLYVLLVSLLGAVCSSHIEIGKQRLVHVCFAPQKQTFVSARGMSAKCH